MTAIKKKMLLLLICVVLLLLLVLLWVRGVRSKLVSVQNQYDDLLQQVRTLTAASDWPDIEVDRLNVMSRTFQTLKKTRKID